ncbi:MAG TPA: endonuclease III [Bacilli bacterium]|nr:endonuclease III [Bacilli bacterium]
MIKAKQARIIAYFDELFPDAKGELEYTKDYELLIAVILSAQATDKSVNAVTRHFFVRYPSLEAMSELSISELENEFKTIGLFKSKAANIKKTMAILLNDYQGRVPQDKAQLMALPGVGIKTSNVVRAELFNIPEIAVDTHVNRVSKRLGFAKQSDSLDQVEAKLRRTLPQTRYIKTHHQMIFFGRYFCKAKNPRCRECQLVDICKEKKKNL